jgi:GMP synthase-like glutamine amidotransferase
LVVIANHNDADAGFVGDRFVERGAHVTTWHRERWETWPEHLDGDVLLILGSDWSVYWDQVAGPVNRELAVVRAAHAAGVPVLGICFGAQIIATALGGSVRRGAPGEWGWHLVESSHAAIEPGPWLQWHGDVCEVPSNMTVLATSAVGPQAFCLGHTLALQFHPEVDTSIVARWASEGELETRGLDREAVLAETRTRESTARQSAGRLVDWFLAEFAGADPR